MFPFTLRILCHGHSSGVSVSFLKVKLMHFHFPHIIVIATTSCTVRPCSQHWLAYIPCIFNSDNLEYLTTISSSFFMVKIIVTSAEDFKSWNTVLVAIRVFIFFWIFLDCIVYLTIWNTSRQYPQVFLWSKLSSPQLKILRVEIRFW